MAENETRLPVKRETMEPSFTAAWHPFESLHREIDRLFDDNFDLRQRCRLKNH